MDSALRMVGLVIALGGWLLFPLLLIAAIRMVPRVEDGKSMWASFRMACGDLIRSPWAAIVYLAGMAGGVWLISRDPYYVYPFVGLIPLTPSVIVASGIEGTRRTESKRPIILAGILTLVALGTFAFVIQAEYAMRAGQ